MMLSSSRIVESTFSRAGKHTFLTRLVEIVMAVSTSRISDSPRRNSHQSLSCGISNSPSKKCDWSFN